MEKLESRGGGGCIVREDDTSIENCTSARNVHASNNATTYTRNQQQDELQNTTYVYNNSHL